MGEFELFITKNLYIQNDKPINSNAKWVSQKILLCKQIDISNTIKHNLVY